MIQEPPTSRQLTPFVHAAVDQRMSQLFAETNIAVRALLAIFVAITRIPLLDVAIGDNRLAYAG